MTDEKKPTEIFINDVRVGVIRSWTPSPVPTPVHELKAVDYTPTGQVDSFNLEFTRTIDLSQQSHPSCELMTGMLS
jgi:hypothetical protein